MNATSKAIMPWGFAVIVVAMLFNAGCSSAWKPPKFMSLDNTWPFGDKDAPQEGTPARIVGTWTDTVLTQAGQKPQRGFGGRLLFYERDGKKPILVDGQLVVYAFDESGREPTDNKPTRRYVFPADQMPVHMSKSELGASYSFWLPWDEAGGPKTEVSLICRFEPKGGAVVTSEQTRHLLPGSAPSAATTASSKQQLKAPEGVPSRPPRQTLDGLQSSRMAERQAQLASYEAPVGGNQPAVLNAAPPAAAQPEKRMTATTITLPQNYQLPDLAAVNAMSAGYANGQVPQQPGPNPAQWQLPAAQPMTITRPGPQQQLPLNSATATFPGSPQMKLGPIGWNNMAGAQIAPQQMQQPMVQQPMLQQPVAQQTMPAQQSWPQMPAQMSAATAVNYPAAGQMVR